MVSASVISKLVKLITCLFTCCLVDATHPSSMGERKISENVMTSSSGNNIAFDVPDLTATIGTRGGEFQLEAYRSTYNDRILNELNANTGKLSTHSINRLSWVSVGQPTFVKPVAKNDKDKNTELFVFTQSRFYAEVQMLTPAHRKVLAALATAIHGVNITESQILNLILSSFKCTLVLNDAKGRRYLLKGVVSNFHKFPLKMDFYAPETSVERQLFVEKFSDNEDNSELHFHCSMSAQGKLIATNTLVINARRMNEIGVVEKLFGSVNNTLRESVYVTREQMISLSKNMYAALNIIEEYEIPETQFSEVFVDEMIRQIATREFTMVPIDTVLASLSYYSFNIANDLHADEIKQELGNILVIEKIGNKSRIVNKRSKNAKNKNDENQGISSRLEGSIFGIPLPTAAFGFGKNNSRKSEEETKSLDDQLHDLNHETKSHIRWQIVGRKVLPKQLNVAKLSRSRMLVEIHFSRVRRQTINAPFSRDFGLYAHANSSHSQDSNTVDQSNMLAFVNTTLMKLQQEVAEATQFTDYIISNLITSLNQTLMKLQQDVVEIMQSPGRMTAVNRSSAATTDLSSLESAAMDVINSTISRLTNDVAIINSTVQQLIRKPTDCPPGFIRNALIGSSCYMIVTENRHWSEANDRCASIHREAHLVFINTAHEHILIKNLLKTYDLSSCHSYGGSMGIDISIGGRRVSNGSFVWKYPVSSNKSNLPLTFTAWSRYEPSNSDGQEDCISMLSGWDYQWNDYRCNRGSCFVCETYDE